jgi:hypothetical protein
VIVFKYYLGFLAVSVVGALGEAPILLVSDDPGVAAAPPAEDDVCINCVVSAEPLLPLAALVSSVRLVLSVPLQELIMIPAAAKTITINFFIAMFII